MTRAIWTSLLVSIALVAYLVAPIVTLYRLAMAAETHDAVGVAARVDLARLRQSLNSQITEAYLTNTGRKTLGRTGSVIAATGMSVADPLVLRILNSEVLLAFLETGSLSQESQHDKARPGPLSTVARQSFFGMLRNSGFGLREFHVVTPDGIPNEDQYRLEFRITQWQWKLVRIGLPTKVRVSLARELAKIVP